VLRDPVATGLGYLVALSAAEVLTALVKPHAGLVLHALLLFDLCMHAAFTWRQPIHRLLLSLTLVPLIRLLSLSLPLAGLDQIYWYLIISIPLFAAAAVIVRLLGLKPAALGLTLGKRLGLQGTVAVVGVLFGAVEYHILHAEPLVDFTGWVAALGPALTLMICTGFLEELIFRGLLQSAAQEVYGSWAILYVSALSAVMYVGYRSLLNVLFVFVVGLILGWVTHRSHSILGAALAHGLTNVVLFLIAPFVFGP
jgi:membrane protease YdiL (CAAX protease family)